VGRAATPFLPIFQENKQMGIKSNVFIPGFLCGVAQRCCCLTRPSWNQFIDKTVIQMSYKMEFFAIENRFRFGLAVEVKKIAIL
jgi:hypothetical protein